MGCSDLRAHLGIPAPTTDPVLKALEEKTRELAARLRPEHPTPPQRELVPRDPGNPPEAITRKDERGATWTLKWQALYEGGIGEERNATAESLASVGFEKVRDV